MQHVLRPAELGPTLRPKLLQDEVEMLVCSQVRLAWTDDHSGGKAAHLYQGCDLVLSSRRLILVLAPDSPERASGLAMDLGQLRKHEKVSGLRSMFASPKLCVTASPPPQPALALPAQVEFTLTFDSSQGSQDRNNCYDRIRTAVHALRREAEAAAAQLQQRLLQQQQQAESGSAAGIKGLLRRQEDRRRQAEQTLSGAFADLDSLMRNASEVVKLAERYGAVLAADARSSESDAAAPGEAAEGEEQFRSVLQDLGMVSPVTKETAGTSYHSQLSRQLAEFVLGFWETRAMAAAARRAADAFPPLQICTLTDAYCLYNRARGTELISPDDLLTACKLFEKLGLPVVLKTFPGSQVLAIEGRAFSQEKLAAAVLTVLQRQPGLTALEMSELSQLPLVLCTEHLLALERSGTLCRDDPGDGSDLRFFPNLFA